MDSLTPPYLQITPQMIEAGVKALREVLGYHEDARSTLVEYDYEAVAQVYSRMMELETSGGNAE